MSGTGTAAGKVERNVVYGMYSGLALLMDIHHPARPNARGVVYVSGSGWSAPLTLDAPAIKDSAQAQLAAAPLVAAGFTVFAINHRAAPRFTYPAPLHDVQRAVRFIRYHADSYGISAERIGAFGGSSGGHLVAMLGVLDGTGDADDESPVNRISAAVQCVVARAPALDLTDGARVGTRRIVSAMPLLLGARPPVDPAARTDERRLAEQASPLYRVSPAACPFLVVHGEADDIVPIGPSERFVAQLTAAGVAAELVRVPGGGHGHGFAGATADPDLGGHAVRWLERHLS